MNRQHTMTIDGHQAVITFDPEIQTFRGEFLGLNGGADCYAKDVKGWQREGRISLKIFLEACAEDGRHRWDAPLGVAVLRPFGEHELAVMGQRVRLSGQTAAKLPRGPLARAECTAEIQFWSCHAFCARVPIGPPPVYRSFRLGDEFGGPVAGLASCEPGLRRPYRELVQQEFSHPFIGNFFGTVGIRVLLLSSVVSGDSSAAQLVVWIIGVLVRD